MVWLPVSLQESRSRAVPISVIAIAVPVIAACGREPRSLDECLLRAADKSSGEAIRAATRLCERVFAPATVAAPSTAGASTPLQPTPHGPDVQAGSVKPEGLDPSAWATPSAIGDVAVTEVTHHGEKVFVRVYNGHAAEINGNVLFRVAAASLAGPLFTREFRKRARWRPQSAELELIDVGQQLPRDATLGVSVRLPVELLFP